MKWIYLLALLSLLPSVAAAQSRKHPSKGPTAQKLGPPRWQCSALGDPNDCAIVQNKLDENGEPILTPLGCFLAKTRITWIFGDRVKYCPHKVKS